MILKLDMDHRGLKVYEIYINDSPRLSLTYLMMKFGQICLLCLNQAQMSGDHLQDHWSSGYQMLHYVFIAPIFLQTRLKVRQASRKQVRVIKTPLHHTFIQ